MYKKVQVGKDHEKEQSEKKISTPKPEVGKNVNLQLGTYTMNTNHKPNGHLFSQ